MLTIILTIILFCILAAIYALYFAKIEGGNDYSKNAKLQANRFMKYIFNSKLFSTSNDEDFTTEAKECVKKCVVLEDNFNGAGCLWFDCSNVCYIKHVNVLHRELYIFPEIGVYLITGFALITEPHVHHYENINMDNVSNADIINETINIYKPLLQPKNHRNVDIINQVANDLGFALHCNILTTTDAEFIETMKRDHPMFYVIYLTSQNELEKAYNYIIDMFDKTLTTEKNINRDTHLYILQYLYEDVSTVKYFLKEIDYYYANSDIIFYLAMLFTIIAGKIENKTNQSYILLSDESIKIINESQDLLVEPRPQGVKLYAPLHPNYIMQSVLVKYVIYTYLNEEKSGINNIINQANVYEFLIDLISHESDNVKHRAYIKNKLTAIYRHLYYRHKTQLNMLCDTFYYINETDAYNNLLNGIPMILKYETIVEIINRIEGRHTGMNVINTENMDKTRINMGVVINFTHNIAKASGSVIGLSYLTCAISRLIHYHIKDIRGNDINLESHNVLISYLKNKNYKENFQSIAHILFTTDDKKSHLHILHYLLEYAVHMRMCNLSSMFDFDQLMCYMDKSDNRPEINIKSPIYIIILLSIKSYNNETFKLYLEHWLSLYEIDFKGITYIDKRTFLAKYMLQYIDTQTSAVICRKILAD